jgi:hypothetical protein
LQIGQGVGANFQLGPPAIPEIQSKKRAALRNGLNFAGWVSQDGFEGGDMFYIGDKVAVLSKLSSDLVTIDTIESVEKDFIRLKNGGIFRIDGESMSSPSSTRIVSAMPEHLTALRQRGQ